MPSAKQFINSFTRAAVSSSNHTFFNDMKSALGGNFISGNGVMNITLDTNLKGADSRVIEDAVRIKFNDSLDRGRYPDAIFVASLKDNEPAEIPVEVKFTSSGFTKLPTDSRNLIDTQKKWYLFIHGDIKRAQNDSFVAWLMRSDELYREMELLQKDSQTPLFPEQPPPRSIDPKSPTALDDIADEIHKIERFLAQKIVERSVEELDNPGEERGSMSLARRVNGRRVRFDIKFESLIRKTISEILKD